MKKLLLFTLLSLGLASSVDMAHPMKRKLEEKQETSNKKLKPEIDQPTACLEIMNAVVHDKTDDLIEILNHETVCSFIDEEIAVLAIYEAIYAKNSVILQTLLNNNTILDVIIQAQDNVLNISQCSKIFMSCENSAEKAIVQILLSNESILYQITQDGKEAGILELLSKSSIYSHRLITPDIANKILVFVVKNRLSVVVQELLSNNDFMNCIDAQGAQAALDNDFYDEYDLLKQNKQIRKLLKLDSWCVIQ